MTALCSEVALGDILKLDIDAVPVDAATTYRIAGVYGFGRGLFGRGPLSGAETTYKKFNRLREGHIVLSQLKGWEGAIARVTSEFDNWFLSPQFPTFSVNKEKAEIGYIEWFCKLPKVWDELRSSSRGMGARRDTVPPARFLELRIPLFSIDEQRRIVTKIELLVAKIEEAKRLQESVLKDAQAMLFSAFNEIIEGAEYRPLSEVAPIIRRPVDIQIDGEYPELGVRSFGKGAFHKPTLKGIEVGTKKLYHIHSGDLLFSNVFAWEGAIAVVGEADVGRVGSHRFITCEPKKNTATAEFLCFYFLSSEGLEKVREASPGGAGRNRTLGLKKLEKIVVPVPAYEKQLWFNQLIAKVDNIKQAQADNQVELDALLPAILDKAFKGELLPAAKNKRKTTKPTIATILPARQLGFMDDLDRRRASIDVYILNRLRSNRDLVRTKMEKISHLIEYRHGVSLERNPIRDAFGPIDFPARIKTEQFAIEEGWYSVKEVKTTRATKYLYRIGKNIDSAIGYAEELIADKRHEVDNFIQLMAPLNARECEIVATLYSAWNDLLIDGEKPSDQKIIDEVLFNWHPSKQDISVDKWQKWLKWMQKHSLIPAGEGKKIPAKAA